MLLNICIYMHPDIILQVHAQVLVLKESLYRDDIRCSVKAKAPAGVHDVMQQYIALQ